MRGLFRRVSLVIFSACLVVNLAVINDQKALALDMANPVDAVKSYQYYYAVAKCAGRNYPAVSVASGEIGNSTTKIVGHLIDSGDGEQECKTLLAGAIGFWGYSSAGDALKDWGYTEPTASNNFWSNTDPEGSFKTAIKRKFYGGNEPSLSAAQLYILYYTSFMAGCKATDGIEYDKADAGVRAAADSGSGDYLITSIVSGDPPAVVKMIYKVDNPSASISIVEDGASIKNKRECRTLANFITQQAPSYVLWAKNNMDLYIANTNSTNVSSDGGGGGASKTTCTITGIGWLLCPVVNFLADITDSAYGVVASMLTVPSIKTSDTGSELYQAWSIVRNLANVCFVIAFLVIIYSQITSAGISNYGIKKMLPKLIVSAILVNVSFWMCALAVDISNFLGYAISGLFSTVGKPITGEMQTAGNSASIGNITTGILAFVGATQFLQLAMLLPLLIGAVFVVVTIVIVLTLRQGLIVMLIVLSPLAFVAYLLPNTNKLFDKWWDAFKALLLMFPVIAFVYAGAALAGKVLSGVAKDMDGTMKIMFELMGATLPILSLIAAYTLMKTSSMLINRALNNNPVKGIGDRTKRSMENRGKRWDNQRSAYALDRGGIRGRLLGGRARGRARAKATDEAAERNARLASAGYIADHAKESDRFASQLGRGSGEAGRASALADAIQTKVELEAKEINAQKAIIKDLNLTDLQKAELASGGSVRSSSGRVLDGRENSTAGLAVRMAAQQAVVESGDADAINAVLNHMSQNVSAVNDTGAKELNNFADMLEKSSSKPAYVQPKNLNDIRQNGLRDGSGNMVSMGGADEMIMGALKDNVYSADRLASSGRQELSKVAEAINRTKAQGPLTLETQKSLEKLKENAILATTDARTKPRLSKQKAIVEDFTVVV